jgi:spore maturation protein CgeB
MLRVLSIGMRYDYGDPRRGDCYEYVNLTGTLQCMPGLVTEFFPFDVVMREKGREEMNRLLLARVREVRPDVCVFAIFTDEIRASTIRTITDSSGALTVNWFADDHWRLRPFSRYWAPLFHYAATTDSAAPEAYRRLGIRNVIKTQWGVNHYRYRPVRAPQTDAVTFVGQVHSSRRRYVDGLRRGGIDVRCYGRGWGSGRVAFEEMLALYSGSAINLNFVEGAAVPGSRQIAKVLLNRRADGTYRVRTPGEMARVAATLLSAGRQQIKGRTFEVPGVGGFLLSGKADNIEEYFVPGEEIALFDGASDLLEKVRHYRAHHAERERIRKAGHARALRDHTYERRFQEIFRKMGIDETTRK